MKKFLVVLLACALIFGFATTALAADTQMTDFSDIADQPQAAKTAIMKLAILGVLEGNEGIGGAFRPADSLTRAEFAKIVNYLTDNVKNADSLASVGSKFPDVSTGNWYTGWVNGAAAKGYFVGDTSGNFRPNAEITMNEVVTVCLRAVGYNDNVSQRRGTANRMPWPTNYVTKANSVEILDDVTFAGSAPATRADMAIIVSAVLDLNMVEYIESDMAFSLALSQGTVDPDGFSERHYISNETEMGYANETILHNSFGCINPRLVFDFGRDLRFDEIAAWDYVDFKNGELQLNFADRDGLITTNNDYGYAGGYSFDVASTYYVNKGYTLPQLAGVQANVIIDIEGKTAEEDEVLFVNVRGTTEYADKVYMDGDNRIVADSKTYRASNQVWYTSENSDGMRLGSHIEDLITTTANGAGRKLIRGTQAQIDAEQVADKDNTMPAKLYIDKDGYVYAVKSYNVFRNENFGIFNEMESNIADFVEDTFVSADVPKLDTSKDYVIVADNQFIKADDLNWLDVVYYMGKHYGVETWLALPSAEGEMTVQNRTDGKLTIDGVSMSPVRDFMYSNDGADTFEARFDLTTVEIDKEDFGEAVYAKAYVWPRLAYAASNTNFNKVIGVITAADPNWGYYNGSFSGRLESLSIYNAEGKEVTYKFTKDFRNGINYFLDWTVDSGVSGAAKWETATSKHADYVQQLRAASSHDALQEGDIVQLVLDKNDNVRRIDNFASYDLSTPTMNVKVNSSNKRVTIADGATAFAPFRGTWTMTNDTIVFSVSPDNDGEYDDVSIMTPATVLSSDFKAAKAVAFDVKRSGDLNVLYFIGDVSVVKFGVLTQEGTLGDGYYFTINGNKIPTSQYNRLAQYDGSAVVAYTMSGGEVELIDASFGGHNIDAFMAWYQDNATRVDGKLVEGPAAVVDNTVANVSTLNSNYNAVLAKVKTFTSGGRNTVSFENDNRILYVTDDTCLYDLVEDEDITGTDLRGETVLAIYHTDYNDAVLIVIVGDGYTHAAGVPSSGKAEVTTVVGKTVSWGNEKGTLAEPIEGTLAVAASKDTLTWNEIGVSLNAKKAVYTNAAFSLDAGDPVSLAPGANDLYIKVTAADGTVLYYHLVVTRINAASNIKTVDSMLGVDVSAGWGATDTGTVIAPTPGTVSAAYSKATVSAADIKTTYVGASVTIYTNGSYTLEASAPIALEAGVAKHVYFIVTAADGDEAYYNITVTRTAVSAVTTLSDVKVKNATAAQVGATAVYNVTMPFGFDISTLTDKDVVATPTDSLAKVSTPVTTDGGKTWTVVVTAENGTTATYTINVYVPVIAKVTVDLGAISTAAGTLTYTDTIESEQLVILDENNASIGYFGVVTVGQLTDIAWAPGGSFVDGAWTVNAAAGVVTLNINNLTATNNDSQNIIVKAKLAGVDVEVVISWGVVSN